MDERLQQYDDKMKKAYEFLESDYGTIRAGRANPHVLDKIRVNYYGTPTPIQQVGNVTVPEARIIQIAPWEKSLLKEIEKAIQTSDLGINPTNDGNVIRLVFPERLPYHPCPGGRRLRRGFPLAGKNHRICQSGSQQARDLPEPRQRRGAAQPGGDDHRPLYRPGRGRYYL